MLKGTLESIVNEDWVDQAVCPQTDPDAFFVEKGGSTRPAKAICQRCPVREPCLKYALDHNERFGVWGGYSEQERRRMKRGLSPQQWWRSG